MQILVMLLHRRVHRRGLERTLARLSISRHVLHISAACDPRGSHQARWPHKNLGSKIMRPVTIFEPRNRYVPFRGVRGR